MKPKMTLEAELRDIGYLQEKARRAGRSIHDNGLAQRKLRAQNWAAMANLSTRAVNFFLLEGEREAVR